MRPILIVLAFAALALPQDPEPAAAPAPPKAEPTDVASVDAIVGALYDVISGPPGARDWDRMRSLFRPDARLLALGARRDGVVRVRELTVEDYVRIAGPGLERDGFFEQETGRDQQSYGDLAQVLSGYEIRRRADDAEPLMRGVNAIQLIRADGRMWITSVAWQQEQDGGPVPDALRRRRDR